METSETKNGKSKTTYIYIFFHLKIVKIKKVFMILALKQPNSEERISTLSKYSRRLLTRTISPKFLNNNLLLWLSYDWLLPIKFQSSRISYCTILYWFQKVIFLYTIRLHVMSKWWTYCIMNAEQTRKNIFT